MRQVGLCGLLEVPVIGIADSVAQLDLRFPTGAFQSRNVQKLLWTAVRFRLVHQLPPLEADRRFDDYSQLADGQIMTGAHIDMGNLRRYSGIGIVDIGQRPILVSRQGQHP